MANMRWRRKQDLIIGERIGAAFTTFWPMPATAPGKRPRNHCMIVVKMRDKLSVSKGVTLADIRRSNAQTLSGR